MLLPLLRTSRPVWRAIGTCWAAAAAAGCIVGWSAGHRQLLLLRSLLHLWHVCHERVL
jgi:hypothetical protein